MCGRKLGLGSQPLLGGRSWAACPRGRPRGDVRTTDTQGGCRLVVARREHGGCSVLTGPYLIPLGAVCTVRIYMGSGPLEGGLGGGADGPRAALLRSR